MTVGASALLLWLGAWARAGSVNPLDESGVPPGCRSTQEVRRTTTEEMVHALGRLERRFSTRELSPEEEAGLAYQRALLLACGGDLEGARRELVGTTLPPDLLQMAYARIAWVHMEASKSRTNHVRALDTLPDSIYVQMESGFDPPRSPGTVNLSFHVDLVRTFLGTRGPVNMGIVASTRVFSVGRAYGVDGERGRFATDLGIYTGWDSMRWSSPRHQGRSLNIELEVLGTMTYELSQGNVVADAGIVRLVPAIRAVYQSSSDPILLPLVTVQPNFEWRMLPVEGAEDRTSVEDLHPLEPFPTLNLLLGFRF